VKFDPRSYFVFSGALGILRSYTDKTPTRIVTESTSKYAQGCALSGMQKQNFKRYTPFSQKPLFWSPFVKRLEIFLPKTALTLDILTCKLPLIVIVVT